LLSVSAAASLLYLNVAVMMMIFFTGDRSSGLGLLL